NVAPTGKILAAATSGATLSAQSSIAVGTPVSFSASATDPSSVDTMAGFAYGWDFGDGTSAAGTQVVHTYAQAGTYQITLKTMDKDSGLTTTTTTITVGSPQSTVTADAGGPYSGTTGSAVGFSGSAMSTNPNDTLTYSWDFGDGTTGTG